VNYSFKQKFNVIFLKKLLKFCALTIQRLKYHTEQDFIWVVKVKKRNPSTQETTKQHDCQEKQWKRMHFKHRATGITKEETALA